MGQAPLGRIPLFIRMDGAVHTTDPTPSTAYESSTIKIEAFLERGAKLLFYDDDDETLRFREGEYFEAEITLESVEAAVLSRIDVKNACYTPRYKVVEFKVLNGAGPECFIHPDGEARFEMAGGSAVARVSFPEVAGLKR